MKISSLYSTTLSLIQLVLESSLTVISIHVCFDGLYTLLWSGLCCELSVGAYSVSSTPRC